MQRKYCITLILGISNLVFYMLLPMPGYEDWDPSMAANAIKLFSETPWKILLFFAHNLVIPITKLFDLVIPNADPQMVVALRESFFSALNVSMMYIFLRVFLKKEFPAILLVVGYIFCQGHWRIATGGEEKDIMLFCKIIYLIGFFQFKGWVDLKIKFLSKIFKINERNLDKSNLFFIKKWRGEYALGIILAFSVMTHLENGILFPTTLFIYLLQKNTWRNIKEQALELTLIFSVASAILVFWYLFLIVGLNGITSFEGVLKWFFEYHLSGVFFKTKIIFLKQYAYASIGLRRFLIGQHFETKHYLFESIMLSIGLLITAWRAYRFSPKIVGAALIYTAFMGGHYFFNVPWLAEAWSGEVFCGFIIIGAGLFARDKGLLSFLGLIFVLWLSIGNIYYYNVIAEKYIEMSKINQKSNKNASKGYNGFFLRNFPSSNLAQYVSSIIKPDSILLLDNPLLITHFLNYTDIESINILYLDKGIKELMKKEHLNVLNIHFYKPNLDSKDIISQMRQGRKVYYLCDERLINKELDQKLRPFDEKDITEIGYDNYVLKRLFLR